MDPRNIHRRCWEPLVARANELASDPNRTDKRLRKIKDVDGRAWHGFRRWVTSYLVAKGGNNPELRAMLGHETAGMTDLYTFVLDSLDPV